MSHPTNIRLTHPELIGLDGVIGEREVLEVTGTYKTDDPEASDGLYFKHGGDRSMRAPEGTYEVVGHG
jgi:hypothetical protein